MEGTYRPRVHQAVLGRGAPVGLERGLSRDLDLRGGTVEDPQQVVLEADPPRRLAYTWQTITPEFARVVGFTQEYQRKAAAEPRSRVAFDLEPVDGLVRLTVVHDGFPEDSEVLKSISGGWPMILSGLKTFLETR